MAVKRRVVDAGLAAATILVAALVILNASRGGEGAPADGAPLDRLRRDPLDLAALSDLGLDLDRHGQTDRADALLSFVHGRTWRDAPTETWLIRRRLSQGRLAEAFDSADALLREDAGDAARNALFPVLIAAAGHVEARVALETNLAASPPWRGGFLQALGAKGDEAGTINLLAALAAGPSPPAPAEYGPLIDRLIAAGDIRTALAAWRQIAPAPLTHGDLRDGDFTATPDGTPFTWRSAGGDGADSEAEAAPDDARRRALRVDYDGYASPTLPAQLLVLPPGAYRIAWRERPDGANAAALFWRLRCADSPTAAGRETAGGAADAGGWRAAWLDFRVPETGCAGQWLELTAAPGERRNPVTVWYAHFVVTPRA